jgi:hypothetical protein
VRSTSSSTSPLRRGLHQPAAGFYPRSKAVPAEVIGEAAPVGGVEDEDVGPAPRGDPSYVSQAEDSGRVGRAGPEQARFRACAGRGSKGERPYDPGPRTVAGSARDGSGSPVAFTARRRPPGGASLPSCPRAGRNVR